MKKHVFRAVMVHGTGCVFCDDKQMSIDETVEVLNRYEAMLHMSVEPLSEIDKDALKREHQYKDGGGKINHR